MRNDNCGIPHGYIGVLISCILLIASTQYAFATEETEDPPDQWKMFRSLVGSWRGDIEGKLGTGTGVRHYEFILNEQFLLSKHSSVRLPQAKSPKGDQHEELGIFSFDRERNKIVYRQFMNEGFVNQYVCDIGTDRFTCVTENVENGTGMRARWTVNIANRYSLKETFELAGSNENFSVFFTNHWTRTPNTD